MTASNGISTHPKWANGPGVPLTTPFKPGNEEIDHEALAKQVVRCAKAGLSIVLLGTTGECELTWLPSILPRVRWCVKGARGGGGGGGLLGWVGLGWVGL